MGEQFILITRGLDEDIRPRNTGLLDQMLNRQIGRCASLKCCPDGGGAVVCHGSVSCFLKYRHKRRERLCGFSAFDYPVSCHVFCPGGIPARIGNGSAKRAPGIAQLRIRLTRLGKSFLEDWTRYSPLLFQAA
jgi:hypothetical protein